MQVASQARGPFSDTVSNVLGGKARAASMRFPTGVDGIFGWDWLSHIAKSRAEFDLLDVRYAVSANMARMLQ